MKSLPLHRIGLFAIVILANAGICLSMISQTSSPIGTPAKRPAKKSVAAAAKTPAPSPSGPVGKMLGSKSAPITMEVFSDFQCPACGAFYRSTLKQLINDYVYTGKVYLVHRDFPLDMHPHAREAARLANAAADLGQFEPVERALFDTQDKWSENGKIDDALTPSISAAELKKLHEYEAAHLAEINASIERDRTMGIQRNVNQTPTVYVTAHGKTEGLPGGGVDYKLLKQYLDYLLRQ